MVELLAPAGNWISLKAAIEAGADSVYFGIQQLNMRAKANNFKLSELNKVTEECHKNKVKAYLTLNTIIYQNELKKIINILKKAKAAKIDAVICWDHAIIKQAKTLKIPIHLSTQASVSNSEAANFYKKLGVTRIILARECSLDQIKEIKKNSKVEIEVFIHGAMCVSVSGRCFTSQFLFNKSANRGECLQPCRREYIVTDEENKKLILKNNFVMSPKDLCTLPFIDKLLKAKIDCFKIEGRMRSPEYVKTVTEVYRQAIDNPKTNKSNLLKKLKTVYNRGFSYGFFLSKPIKQWTDKYGSKATTKKQYVGKVLHFYKKLKVAEINIESNQLKIGDTIMFQGNKTGTKSQKLTSMQLNKKPIKQAKKTRVGIKTNSTVRVNDKVYLLISNKKTKI